MTAANRLWKQFKTQRVLKVNVKAQLWDSWIFPSPDLRSPHKSCACVVFVCILLVCYQRDFLLKVSVIWSKSYFSSSEGIESKLTFGKGCMGETRRPFSAQLLGIDPFLVLYLSRINSKMETC